jgi:hypothetical protein
MAHSSSKVILPAKNKIISGCPAELSGMLRDAAFWARVVSKVTSGQSQSTKWPSLFIYRWTNKMLDVRPNLRTTSVGLVKIV